jgi:large subunit ribosomal protein L23
VELAFKVRVTGVNVLTVPGASHRMGRRLVTTSPWKKAIVTLAADNKIQLFEGV